MTTAEILSTFPELSALVVGDVCLDRWCRYDPALAEPSRETGIPRLAVVATETTPGAGGTVANNLAALGAGRVAVLGVVGEDGFARELNAALEARGIDGTQMVRSRDVCTFTYTKLINQVTGEEDCPRVDFINSRPLPAAVETEVVDRLLSIANAYDVIFVSDQAETDAGGVVTEAVRDALSSLRNRVIWVDSRRRSMFFRNVTVKINEDEAAAACSDPARLRQTIGSKPLFITLGGRGVRVLDDSSDQIVAGRHVAPVDICGAGDSFSAAAAMTLAVTGLPLVAAHIGNLVASITITKPGTGTATPGEVLAAEAGFPCTR